MFFSLLNHFLSHFLSSELYLTCFVHFQGPATIRVSKPNENDGQVMEITVQSLSENVGSLKEKIAGEMQIPANKQK